MADIIDLGARRAAARGKYLAWRGFVEWAVADPEMLLRYERATGRDPFAPDVCYQDIVLWLTDTYWDDNPNMGLVLQ
jgi:hypothetical protein